MRDVDIFADCFFHLTVMAFFAFFPAFVFLFAFMAYLLLRKLRDRLEDRLRLDHPPGARRAAGEIAFGQDVTLVAKVSGAEALNYSLVSDESDPEDGVVTVSKSAKAGRKAKITVTTSNGKKMYIYVVVR